MFGYLTRVRLKFLLITFAAGAAVMQVYARLKVRNGAWFGIPDFISGVLVVSLGSVVFNVLMAAIMKIGRK